MSQITGALMAFIVFVKTSMHGAHASEISLRKDSTVNLIIGVLTTWNASSEREMRGELAWKIFPWKVRSVNLITGVLNTKTSNVLEKKVILRELA